MKDLNGEKYGRLTVIKKADRPYYWICVCDCGKEKEVRSDHLKSGKIRSCGCLQSEISKKYGHERSKYIAGKNRIDITGRKFGRLTALYVSVPGDKNHSEMWVCKCECGAEQEFLKSNLLSGHTTSCGCKMSKFEELVGNMLSANGIKFVKNKTFRSCKFKNGSLAKFDFFVRNSYVIECDGEQHYKNVGGSFYTEEMLQDIREKDSIKEKWCAENGIPLIRLSYNRRNNLSIEDLIPSQM